MAKNLINTVRLEGYLYNHELEQKVTGPNSKAPGTQYITGKIEIATNEACDNIVPVYYTYVTAVTNSGKSNQTYTALLNILEGRFKTVMNSSKEEAYKLRVDSAIGLNEFYSNQNGDWELVSNKRNVGGFIHNVPNGLNPDEKERNYFGTDILITSCIRKEADEEKDIPEKVLVKGAIFDFRGALLPIELVTYNEGAMNYFEGLGASNQEPVFTKVWGSQLSTTVVRKIEEPSAFGDSYVREVRSSRREFVITGANRDPYIWDDESSMTANELKKTMSDRETYLATLKQNAIDYQNNKNTTTAIPAAKVASGGYDF